MSDVVTRMAEDIVEHLNSDNRDEMWTETYDVNLFGQKYTVNVMVEMRIVGKSLPLFNGGIRLDTKIRYEMLANSEAVVEEKIEYAENPRDIADNLRQRMAMAHGRRMSQMDYQKYGNTLF